SGIVYCLTKRDTETVAEWLQSQGISAVAYSGEVADADRVRAEGLLLRNEVKAVVATSALGMGYDKPDLGFVVHYQAPSSAFAYGEDGRCLMQALQAELDDPAAERCGRCSVCAGPRFDTPVDAGLARAAHALVRSKPVVLTVRRQTPKTADAPGKKIAAELQLEEGRALGRSGDGGWDPLVVSGRREGRFADDLVQACVDVLGRWRPDPAPEWVTAVPSRRVDMPEFARRLASALGVPYV